MDQHKNYDKYALGAPPVTVVAKVVNGPNCMEVGVWGLGVGAWVWGLKLGVWDLGLRLRCWVLGFEEGDWNLFSKWVRV